MPAIHVIDQAIIVVYLIGIVVAGILLSRRASESIDSYFLGGRSIPWYLLGVSNASGMFDITGTMLAVTWLFIYGLKSIYIPWIWPTFNQIFLMIFLAIWLRRSGVLTGAEWLSTRFGRGKSRELSHISVVTLALVAVISMLAYAFVGIGKFAVIFLPWDFSAETYAVLFMSLTAIYVIAGGMYSVVVTDVVQFILMTTVSIFVGVIAIARTTHGEIFAAVPEGWQDIGFTWKLDLDWTGLVDQVNVSISESGYEMFGAFLMVAILKGVLASMAGPTPGYDMQRVLATRTAREAALMSGLVSPILYVPRYFLVAGITVLGLVSFSDALQGMGDQVDFEQVLPYVIRNFVPVGLTGILLAGLLAAFMSTFDSTVNSGAAYVVNDLYKRYIRRDESHRHYVVMSYFCSLLIVATGIFFGYRANSIDRAVQWITAGLYGGYVIPNFLKWYWWRFNAAGYFAGMTAGLLAALLFGAPDLYPQLAVLPELPLVDSVAGVLLGLEESVRWNGTLNPFQAAWYILAVSGLASVGASLVTPAEPDEVLQSFYRTVRPWGIWGPVRRLVVAGDSSFQPNNDCLRDLFNCLVGVVWQVGMTAAPVYLVLRMPRELGISLLAVAITTVILKVNWYDKLPDD